MNKWYRVTFSVQRAAVVKANNDRAIRDAIELAEQQVGGVTSNDVVAVETISEDDIRPEDVFLCDDQHHRTLEDQKDQLKDMFNNKEHDDGRQHNVAKLLDKQRQQGEQLCTTNETVQDLHNLIEFGARKLLVEAGYPETNHNINLVMWDITAATVSWSATFSKERLNEILDKKE